MRQYLYALMSHGPRPASHLRPPTAHQTAAAHSLAETAYNDRSRQPYHVEDMATYNLHLVACSRRRLLDPATFGLSAGQDTTNRLLRDMSTAYASTRGTDSDPSLAFQSTASP
jgi:hypothetical protein